jgi:aspartyl protease family protein
VSDGALAALLALTLILPLSALIARRVPVGQTAKLAALWIVIFAVAAVAVTQVDRWRGSGRGDPATTHGQPMRIQRDVDGHYWADARINGVERRMLIDTGATTTALSMATAKATNIDIEGGTFPRMIETANGSVLAQTASAGRVRVGTIETRDLPVLVSDSFGDQDIIDMNFLSRLKSWPVEGKQLVLTPPTDGR